MYEKVAIVTVSIEETVSLGQGERGPDRDSYFPITTTIIPMKTEIIKVRRTCAKPDSIGYC